MHWGEHALGGMVTVIDEAVAFPDDTESMTGCSKRTSVFYSIVVILVPCYCGGHAFGSMGTAVNGWRPLPFDSVSRVDTLEREDGVNERPESLTECSHGTSVFLRLLVVAPFIDLVVMSL